MCGLDNFRGAQQELFDNILIHNKYRIKVVKVFLIILLFKLKLHLDLYKGQRLDASEVN